MNGRCSDILLSFALLLLLTVPLQSVNGFATLKVTTIAKPMVCQRVAFGLSMAAADDDDDGDDETTDEEGLSLAADFFKIARERQIELGEDDLLDDDEEEEDDDDDDDDDDGNDDDEGEAEAEAEMEMEDAVEAEDRYELVERASAGAEEYMEGGEDRGDFLGQGGSSSAGGSEEDTGDGGAADADEADTPDSKGAELKYLDMQRRWRIDDRDYAPPAQYPDPNLSAGEVVELVCRALANNDDPTVNKGLEIFFAYSSDASQVKQTEDLSYDAYKEYLMDNKEYHALFSNEGVFLENGDYSADGMKAYFTARLLTGAKDFTAVNFILSTSIDGIWMIDSMLIRPASMRRRRRRR